MADSRPQMEPGGMQSGMTGGSAETFGPSQLPPAASINAEFTTVSQTIMAGASDTAPALPLTAVTAIGASTWQNNKKFNALWSINQNRNSWVGVEGIGWKKLANNSDSAIVALTMLASHARQKGSIVNYREEADGMIYEMYVW
jgi:hypothetical protein